MDMNTAQLRGLPILLVEDDAVSALYLADTLAAMGCSVHQAADGHAALAAARAGCFAVLLIDLHLPGLAGAEVLSALRADAQAASRHAPAIATCAGLEPERRAQLLAAGFDDALSKPLTREQLYATLLAWSTEVTLDDARGCVAAGSATALAALRALLAEELLRCAGRLDGLLAHDRGALGEQLHKLRAGCGFCGATALGAVAADLEAELRTGGGRAATVARFRALLATTRVSLLRVGAGQPVVPSSTPPADGRPGAR